MLKGRLKCEPSILNAKRPIHLANPFMWKMCKQMRWSEPFTLKEKLSWMFHPSSGWKFLPLLITPLLEKKYQRIYFSLIREHPLKWKGVPGLTTGWKGKLVSSWIWQCHKTFKPKQQLPLSSFTSDLNLAHTGPVVPYRQCSAWRGNQELKAFVSGKQGL